MKNKLRITAAQINPIVGDIKGNTNKIITAALYARDQQQADMIVFPETVLTGYPPEDLLLRPELYTQIKSALKTIQNKVKNIYLLLGLPTQSNNIRFNTAILIYNKKIIAQYNKQHLPNYGVFDEKRYFTPGTAKTCLVTIKNTKISIAICADLLVPEPMQAAKKAKAQLMISLNASPFDIPKFKNRECALRSRAREGNMPIIYVNLVGGQDELVFDGGSMVLNAQGNIIQLAPFFDEKLMLIDITASPKLKITHQPIPPTETTEKLVYNALVLGVRDYVEKNNFKKVVVGTSGGIDSALTLAIAVDALGKDRVEAIYMPSRYSSKISTNIASTQAKILGVQFTTISIEKIFQSCLNTLTKKWEQLPKNHTEENIQARCRGMILMACSNKKDLLVLSTGNKSEMAVGYTTLYGDMVGGFCVLKDVPKTLIYRLAHYRNNISNVIPKKAISRSPSAELSLNQKDEDNLPPYPILDKILRRYIEQGQSIKKIVAAGFDKKTVNKIVRLVNRSEHKRRQAPPGVKITTYAFGRERRYPITSRFSE